MWKVIFIIRIAIMKSTGSYRPITDCSRPAENAVNQFMDEILCPFSFVCIQGILQDINEGDFLSVVDLQSAYRAVAIHPQDRCYFGLCWHSSDGAPIVLNDNFLCFGVRIAPGIFNTIPNSVVRMLTSMNIDCCSYLDDFLIRSSTRQQAISDLYTVITLLRELRFFIAWSKVQDPSNVVQYLGFKIDTVSMCCSLPVDKLQKVDRELAFWSNRSQGTWKQLSKLAGILNHACRVVKCGKLYMHFVYKALAAAKEKNRITQSNDFFSDLRWWRRCLTTNNCIPIGDQTVCILQLMMFNTGETWELCSELAIYKGKFENSDDEIFAYSSLDGKLIMYCQRDDSDNVSVLDILMLWVFLSIHKRDLQGVTLMVYCHRISLHDALFRLRCKFDSGMLILREIYVMCEMYNILLCPFFDPL